LSRFFGRKTWKYATTMRRKMTTVRIVPIQSLVVIAAQSVWKYSAGYSRYALVSSSLAMVPRTCR
jgi:hypothetical protein